MKSVRVALSTSVVVAVLLFFFLVPLPVSRVRQLALVELVPDCNHKVFVQVPGILEELKVRDGQPVQKGEVIARFSSRDIDTELLDAQTQYQIRVDQLRDMPRQIADAPNDQERNKVKINEAILLGERDAYAARVATLNKKKAMLVLTAPADGIVMSCPKSEDIGKLWEKSEDKAFCTIGDPTRLQALMPVTAPDMSLLKEDQEYLRKHNQDLEVTLRVHGRDSHTWRGELAPLPEQDAKEVPPQLTNKAGGPLAVKPGTRPGVFAPQGQVYLVHVHFVFDEQHSGNAVYPGTMAQVKIHCRYRTCWWWVYRTVSSVFDLRLI